MPKDTPDQSRPGAPRREPSRFEPPPWEKERFDELAQKRLEREEVERVAAEAARAVEAARANAARQAAADTAAARDAGETLELTTAGAPAPAAPVEGEGATASAEGAGDEPVPSAELEEMFQELSVEEGDGLGSTAESVRLGIGAALVVLGAVFAFVAMRLLASSFEAGGPAVLVGSTIVGFMGVALAGAGLYLVVRSLRERGVM